MGQNLAPNPSFEEHSYCPSNFNQGTLEIVTDWKQASKGTADYFNVCSKVMGIPDNAFGTQEAKDGEGYLGLVAFAPSTRNYREYMQAKLDKKLGAGQKYCVSFYISLADKSEFIVDGMGAVFTKSLIKNPGQTYIPRATHVTNPLKNVLDNPSDWILLSDIYEADGGEQYITLGNFKSDRDNTIKKRNVKRDEDEAPWIYSYYYIDQLSVLPISEIEECNCTIPLIAEEMKDSLKWKVPRGEKVTIDNILFAFDEDILDGTAREQLNEVVGLMRNNDFLYLEVMGHTDKVGRDGYNVELSERRAQQVISYLNERGIDKRRLSVEYYGSSKPVASNVDSQGRKQNRRVEFMVLEKEYQDYDGR
jgi:outer membrane protein OmpA-like peptidoglycan-associated protein